MPHDLFTGVGNPRITVGGQKWYTVPLSIVAHTAVIAVIVIVPLMATDSLPEVPSMLAFVAVAPPPPPPPPPPARPAQPVTPSVQRTPSVVPLETPTEIALKSGVDTVFEMSVAGAGDMGVPDGIVGGAIVGGLPDAPPSPPAQEPVRPGGHIKVPVKTRHVRPTYPPIAQSARVQGLVILEAIIGANGRVTDAKVLRSIPLLDHAALEAVRQWEFTPTLLNGMPVPVAITVTVQFSLQ
jgi:periplasmic protein TonB